MKTSEDSRQDLYTAILQGEREIANSILDTFSEQTDYKSAMLELMQPVLVDIGLRWKSEQISLAQGYIAGKIAEDCLEKVNKENDEKKTGASFKGPVIIGNVEDDFHALGRKLVITFLRFAGWNVIDIGNDVPAEEFVDQAVTNNARIIGASAMMYTTAENIITIRREIDRRALSGKIKLAAGGAVFRLRPELAAEVGADGTAADGILVPELFERLFHESISEVPQ